MINIDGKTLLAVADWYPRGSKQDIAQKKIIDAIGPKLAGVLNKYEINTRLRIAHWIGQTCVESDNYVTTREYADGLQYEGRADLGNTQPGDGKRFPGAGIIQQTGRFNYTWLGPVVSAAIGYTVDFIKNPELAQDPVISLYAACEYWKKHNLNAAADRDDIMGITKAINGGSNGLKNRIRFTAKAKSVLAGMEAGGLGTVEHGVVYRGCTGDAVAGLQRCLRAAGYQVAVDGDFGPGTEVALFAFQKSKGLIPDGIAGPATWAALPEPVEELT